MAFNINEKKPIECTNITEVRKEIDTIDMEIIRLLSTRMEYVQEVVKYKNDTHHDIEAADRRAEVLHTRGSWAEEAGLKAEVIEDIYSILIDYFIEEEKKIKNLID